MFVTPAYAQAQGATGVESLSYFLPIILIMIVFYFLLFRPQQKKAKEHKDMVEAVKRGDQVITAGGIVGKVIKVGEEGRITVEIAPNVKVEVLRGTLADVLSKPVPASADLKKKESKPASELEAVEAVGLGRQIGIRDYYAILGVPRSAKAGRIREVYRELAKQHHPDTSKDDPIAAERFKEIQAAYDILADVNARAQYDSVGHVEYTRAKGVA
ncbi:MAG: preprotein translocase subunit YajC [Alphaproteobacteria bacterium]|nr:preprotein translocase subunit YajC [Alphaproteobacteria bacterium]